MDLKDFIAWGSYAQQRPAVFPQRTSEQWVLRSNKRALIEAGALTLIGGRWCVHPELADKVLFEVSQRKALESLARSEVAA